PEPCAHDGAQAPSNPQEGTMIRRKEDHIRFDRQIAGGPGLIHATQLLNEGEFHDKGRLFNIVRLGPGEAVGRHQHVGDMEVYHILKGQCRYDDNGTEVMLQAGDTAVCPDGEWHAVHNDGPGDMEMVCLILFTR
ncbi:cupin domain-containing protein, partial [Desulfovibrio piger]